jgi:sugar/nucleoside kinase (ribokinase family)
MSFDVLTFGEAMAMFIADQTGELDRVTHFTRGLAGAETNVAVGLSRLGYKVGWVSKVGNDSFGRFIIETLKAEGVDTSHVQMDPHNPTGFLLKSKVESGDPQVEYFRKGSAASKLGAEDVVPDYFSRASHLHMTGIPPALSTTARDFSKNVLCLMKSMQRTVSFDPNLRPQLWKSEKEMIQVINEFAMQADIVLPGISEGEILTGYTQPRDIAAFYLDQGVKLVVVKLGSEGAYYRTEKEEEMVPGYRVERVIDTVGAGDGFAVGIISGILDGLSLTETVSRANAIGALAVMSPGDMDGLPTRDELESFMQDQRTNTR